MDAQDWLDGAEARDNGGAVALVAVVEHRGSVPRTTGAVALVIRGTLAGTVGGGIAEAMVVERAGRVDVTPQLVPYVHEPPFHDSVCSGSQTFAIVPLPASDAPVLKAIGEAVAGGRCGALALSPVGVAFEPDRVVDSHLHRSDERWLFTTTVGAVDTLTLIGGGHVSLAMSKLATELGFRVRVLDDRDDLPTMAANEWAHERRVVDYADVARHVPTGEQSWVVIMTQGHRHDGKVLAQLAGAPVRYLGMLGSTAKVRDVFKRMRDAGIADEDLAAVRAPVGLAIGSHTPAEIAVSIAAQLIAERHGVVAAVASG